MKTAGSSTARTSTARRVVIGVATAATVAGTAMAAVPAAHAEGEAWGAGSVNPDSRCSGLGFDRMIRDDHLGDGVRLQVYYSGQDGGTNCANVVNTAGGPKDLGVYLSFPSADGGGARDSGHYSSYAGSVLLKGSNGSCIDVMGEVNGKRFERMGVHCG